MAKTFFGSGIDLRSQKVLNLADGTASSDAAAYGQLTGLSAITPSGGTLAITGAQTVSSTLVVTGKLTGNGGARVAGTTTTPVVGYVLTATNTSGDVDWQAATGGGLAASGTPTAGTYTKWASSTTLANALVSETGTAVTIAGTIATSGSYGATIAGNLAVNGGQITTTYSGGLQLPANVGIGVAGYAAYALAMNGTVAKVGGSSSFGYSAQNQLTPDTGMAAYGLYVKNAVDATGITATSYTGFLIDTATKVSGTVTTAYGLYVNTQNIGGSGNYAIYTAGSTAVSFGGLVYANGGISTTGNLTVASGSIITSGTIVGRSALSHTSLVDASGQGGSGNVIGTDDSGVTLKVISGQSAIFDNDGGILSLPTSGAVTIPAVYGGRNPALTNVGGATSGSNTITLVAAESIVAQGTVANATITTLVGLDIGAMTGGATNNYGLRIAAPSGGSTQNKALSIGGGIMSIDGSGNIITNGTLSAGSTVFNSTNGGVTVMRIQSPTNPTAPMQTWENNGGNITYASLSGVFNTSLTAQTGFAIAPNFNGPNASTLVNALVGGGNFATTGTTPTITEFSGLKVPAMASGTVSASTTVTYWGAVNIVGQGTPTNTTVTTMVGLDIGAMTGGATNNYGLRIAAPSGGATINRAIDVGAGAFIVDNAGTIGTTKFISLGSVTPFPGSQLSLRGTMAKVAGTTSASLDIETQLTPDTGQGGYGIYLKNAIDATGITVPNYYGIYLDTATKILGTVTNAYGLYIAAPTIGGTSNTAAFFNGNFTLNAGSFNLTGTLVGRGAIVRSNTIDATGQGGSGNVIGTNDSGVTLKIISGQSAIFDNDGGILSLPISGAVTIPAVYGGQNPAITNVGGATSGSNTITLAVAESLAAQGTIANATITTLVGLDIGAMTGGATNNYGLRIAAPSGGATINRAIDVAGGAFYVDGSGNIVTTGTITATGAFTASSVTFANQSDVVAITVKGFSTQTNMLQLWQNNTPTTVASLSNNGNMGLGAVGTAAQMLYVTGTLAAPSASGSGYGVQITTTIPLTAATTTGNFLNIAGAITSTTGVNITQAAGIQINSITGSGGGTVTLPTLAGLIINSQAAITGISTVTNAYGAFITGPATGTTRYGLYVAGGSTAGQAFYAINTASSTVPLATFDASATTNGIKIILDKTGHMNISQAAAPTVGNFTANFGSAPSGTCSTASTDQQGNISVTVGSSPTAAAGSFQVTFKNAYATAPSMGIVVPTNSNATAGRWRVGSISTTGFFVAYDSTTALTAAAIYTFSYLII